MPSPKMVVKSGRCHWETGQQKIVVDEAINPYYVSTGHLVYQAGPFAVWAAPFDLARLEVRGDSVLILEGVRRDDFAASGDGTLVYVPGSSQTSLVWVDRDGTQRVVTKSERFYTSSPRISPDGKRVALGIDGGRLDLRYRGGVVQAAHP